MNQEHLHDNPLSRRSLLTGSTTAAATAFTILKPEQVRAYQANSKITVGLIGCGGRGTYDAQVVINDGRAQVTELADLFPDRTDTTATKLKLTGAKTHKDYQKLLAGGVDAVIIATPPFEHPPMLEAAVQARKHIYCEKPMGVDVAGCQRVIAAGKKHDAKKNLSVGFQQRYGDVYLEAYKRLQAGDIGPIVTARAAWISQDPFKRQPYDDPKIEKVRNWFAYKDLSGDFIVEQDCHNFDVLHWFLGGLPVSAVGHGGTKVRKSMDLMDHLSLTFLWPDDVVVNFEANQITPPGYSKVGEEFTGTKGSLFTSRSRMVHIKGRDQQETKDSQRDITNDAFKIFLDRIQNGNVENVAERSAHSTMIAILGREALYRKKEMTWKGLFGA